MSTWLAQFYLGIFGAWLAVVLYARLCIWWKEGRQDLQVEVMEHHDPRLDRYRGKD